MSRSFKPGDIVLVKYRDDYEEHNVVRISKTMDNKPVVITTKIEEFGEIPRTRRVGSIILDNTPSEYQWFYPEDFGTSIWNTVDKLSLKCWGRKDLGG